MYYLCGTHNHLQQFIVEYAIESPVLNNQRGQKDRLTKEVQPHLKLQNNILCSNMIILDLPPPLPLLNFGTRHLLSLE